MATYEGTTDDLLRRFGSRVRDYDLTSSTDGERISRSRAMAMINRAQTDIHRRVRRSGNLELLAREVTLTQDSSDTSIWYLPTRCVNLFRVRDSDTTLYSAVNDPWDMDEPGYVRQNRTGVIGSQIQFRNIFPNTAVYALCIEEPSAMVSGANSTTTTTSLTMPTSGLTGTARNTADYYANVELAITSGNNAGDIQTISASTIALACTVASWTTATPAAGTDTFSTLCSLPRELWDAVCAAAAFDNLATDKEIIEFAKEMREARDETFELGLLDLLRFSADQVKEPRQTIDYIR